MESHKRRWKCILPGFIFALAYIINSFVIARNIERYDTAYECEGKTLRIECQEGELIHLIRANYGRFSITICNEHGNTDWSVNCMSLKSFRVLYSKCNQQQNCSIIASTSQFGDPCPTTLKYLEAHYQCISASTTTTTTSRPSPPWLLTSQSTWNTDFTVPWVSVSKNPVRMSTPSTHGVISQLMSTFTTAPTAVSVSSKSKTTKIWSTDDHERKVKNDFDTNSSRNSPSVPSLLSNTSSLRPPYSVINSTLVFGRNNFRTSTDSSSGPFCPAQYARALMWNATRQGETAVQKCPEGANGLARWHCVTANKISNIPQAVWNRGTPDLSECRSVWLSSLQRRVQTGEIILGISSDLSQVTNNSRELYGGDMLVTTNILRSMATKMAEDVKTYHDPGQREVSVAELLQGVITTGSNLLDEAQSASWGDLSYKEQMVVANSLLISLEENAFLLADTFTYEKTIVHDRRNILMEVRVLEARNLEQFEVFPKDLLKRDKWSKLQNRIELTKSALLSNENTDGFVRLVFMAFDRLEEILQPRTDNSDYPINKFTTTLTKDLNVTQILNSKVISASLGKGKHVQLREPITLYFHHLTYVNVTNPKCVFWNFTISRWSMEGCVTRESNETHTVCECNHLTNFAVLMDVQAVHLDVVHKLALQIITYIGCIISVICLALAIITFQLFRGLKSDRTTIHKNLCICLLVAEILFIFGIGQTNQKVICGIIAGLLHFVFLCAFAWMFFEGFQLYVMLIEVFEAEKSRLRWYYLVAYGTPLLVVLISCAIDPFSYGTDHYCWLRADNYFIFSFVGPVIIVILANVVFLSMAIYMMCRHANTTVTMKSKEHSRLASARVWLRGSIVLVFLLGLTWTFGLLYLNQETVVMAYIFTILNSFQGLFIFVFHCVQNEKVQKEYRKFIRRHSWLPKCLRCSKESGLGISAASAAGTGANGGKDFTSHNTSSNPSAPTTDSSGLSPHTNSNSTSSKSHLRTFNHGNTKKEESLRVFTHNTGYSNQNSMTLQGYSLRARERRLLGDLEIGSRATTGRRAASPYNHTYTEIRENRQFHPHQFSYQHHNYCLDDPVYEEIEKTGGVLLGGCTENAPASDISDEDGRRQSDMSRQSSRSYGDHRPLIPYSPVAEHNIESVWVLDKFKRQHSHESKQIELCDQDEHLPQLRTHDHTRTIAVLDGHTVVCHLQPQAESYPSSSIAPPSYTEC